MRIRAPELRVIGPDGANLGVISLPEALKRALEAELDLVEISPDARPPVAKITDYGKYRYEEEKKRKQMRSKVHVVEVKSVQVKIATGEHDLGLKAKNISRWLAEGHRVKVGLYLSGRAKYLNETFLRERLERILRLITLEYRIASGPERGPKGLSVIVERNKKK